MKNIFIASLIVIIMLIGAALFIGRNTTNQGPTVSTILTPSPTVSASTVTTAQVNFPITITNFAFSNPDITVKVGDTITWTNHDSTAHTVSSTDGGPLNSGNIASNGAFSYTFNAVGVYHYRCAIHASMMGTVTVK